MGARRRGGARGVARLIRLSCRATWWARWTDQPATEARAVSTNAFDFRYVETSFGIEGGSQMGLTIKIYLPDGQPSGIRTARILNSAIQAIAFRKAQLADVRKRFPEIERPGAYVLIGADDPDKPVAYIGESESVGDRLARHRSNASGEYAKPFWTDTVALVSKDDDLTKSHARYVEACLVRRTSGNVRWSYPNAKNPSEDAGKLPQSDRDVMDAFVEQAQILVGVLGWDLFRDMRSGSASAPNNAPPNQKVPDAGMPIFTFRGEGFSAEMTLATTGDCVVRANSSARTRTTPTFPRSAAALRAALIEKGFLRQKDDTLVFDSDYSFSSPSAAAAVVMGASANGRVVWKLPDGRTFGDWETAKALESGGGG